MRSSTATLILAFCAFLSVQAAPLADNGDLAVRNVELGNTFMARGVEIGARDDGLEARQPKKYVFMNGRNCKRANGVIKGQEEGKED